MFWEVIGKKHELSSGIPWGILCAVTQLKFLIVLGRLDLLSLEKACLMQESKDELADVHSWLHP